MFSSLVVLSSLNVGICFINHWLMGTFDPKLKLIKDVYSFSWLNLCWKLFSNKFFLMWNINMIKINCK